MPNKISVYYSTLRNLTENIIVTDNSNRKLNLSTGVEKAMRLIDRCNKCRNKLIFIGNGASAAISSHMAIDFWKNGKIRTMAFNDAALLTCVSNDFGYEHVFAKPIEMFAENGDILIAISSSGQSANIIQAAKMARLKGVRVITLSGFDRDNPISKLGQVNFYVPSSSYGHVEVVHHSICHCLVDNIIYKNSKSK